MRFLVSGNLMLGLVAYALLAVGAVAQLLFTLEGDVGGTPWVILGGTAGFFVSLMLWCHVHDEDRWEETSKAMKWLCFFITPWGMFLGLGFGVVVIGLMVLMGAGGSGGSGKSDPPYNSFEGQRKREAKLALESAVNADIRRRAEQKAANARPHYSDWTWGNPGDTHRQVHVTNWTQGRSGNMDLPAYVDNGVKLREEEVATSYSKYSPSVKWVYEPNESERRGPPITASRTRSVRIVSRTDYSPAQPIWIVGWRGKMSPNTEWVDFTNDPRADPVMVVGRDQY